MGKRIYSTFTDEQIERINALKGILGSSKADVVSTIVAMWLYNEKKK